MTQATFVHPRRARQPSSPIRLCVGPSLADRVIALNGLVLVGMGAIATHAAHTGVGRSSPPSSPSRSSGPIGNGMIARFIEGRES